MDKKQKEQQQMTSIKIEKMLSTLEKNAAILASN